MDIAPGERNLSEFRWRSLAILTSILGDFLTVHLGALVIGLVLTYFGLRAGTTIQSLFSKSGLLIIGSSILVTRLTKHEDFRQGCWTKIFESETFSHWFDWRIISLLTGVGLSCLFVSSIPWVGNFVTDGSPLLFLFPIDYIDLGFSIMRTNIRTAQRQPTKRIIFVAIISYVGSICVITILTRCVLPFCISGVSFLDCLAFGAICSCVDPNFCTKFLGLERSTTRSLHYSLVVEYVISNFLGSLVILCIRYERNSLILWVITVMTYYISGYVGKWLAQLYSSVWDNFEPIFLEERRRMLYEVSFGIWCFLFVACSITTWLHLDLSMVAVTFSTSIVYLTGLRPLNMYNGISSYLDVAGYVRIGLFALHRLHSWSAYPLVCVVLLVTSVFGRVPALFVQFYLSGRVMTRAELAIVWLAGLVRGGYALTLAMSVFGAAKSNESNRVLMSATISMALVTNFFIGFFSPWIVWRNFPLFPDQVMDLTIRMEAWIDVLSQDN